MGCSPNCNTTTLSYSDWPYMSRHAVDHNDVMLAIILFALAFVTVCVIFLIERLCGRGANRRLRRTFHLNETYGRGWLFANRNIGSNHGGDEVKQPSGTEVSGAPISHLTATTSVQNIEDSDELGGGVELRIKIYSPFTY